MKFLVRMLLGLMISFSIVNFPVMKAHAGMITTTEAVQEMTRAQGEQTVANFLGRDDVKKELIKLGVDPIEATSRLAVLSDSEVKKLSMDIKEAQAGGAIVGILVVVLVILGIIYLAKRV